MRILTNKYKAYITPLEDGGSMVQIGDFIETIDEQDAGAEPSQDEIIRLSQEIGNNNLRSKSIAKMSHKVGEDFTILQRVLVS